MIFFIYYLFSYIYIKLIGYFNYIIDIKYIKKIKDKNTLDSLIVTLTTIPSRSPYILDTINSILCQTVLPSKICIGIPYSSAREPHLKYAFPQKIHMHPLINIIYYESDDGPIMKLLTGLREGWNGTIITIDDDTIYEKHLIENLTKQFNASLQKNVICSIGRNKEFDKIYSESTLLTTLEGYGGVLYNSSFFNLLEMENKIKEMPYYIRTNDDLFISAYLRDHNIKIQCIKNHIKEPFCRFINTNNSNPLWSINEENDDNSYFNQSKKKLNFI